MAYYPKEIKEKLNNMTPIADLMREEGERIEGRGKTLSFYCPKCGGDLENGKINTQQNFFTCFKCRALGNKFSGKPINYLQEKYGFSLPEAIEYLAARNNFELPTIEYNELEEEKITLYKEVMNFYHTFAERTEYLINRGVSKEVIDQYKIGYAPGGTRLKNHLIKLGYTIEQLKKYNLITNSGIDRYFARVVIPIMRNGQPYDFYTRRVDDSSHLKHLYQEGESVSFGEDHIPYFCEFLDVYESIINKLVAESNGYSSGIAIGGCTKFSGVHKLLIKKRSPKCVRLIFDADREGQGQRAAFEVGSELIKLGYDVKVVLLPIGKDAADVLLEEGKEAYQEYLDQALDFETFKAHYLLKDIDIQLIKKHLGWRENPCSSSLPQSVLKSLFFTQ